MNREVMLQIAKECLFWQAQSFIDTSKDAYIAYPADIERFANRMMAEALRDAAKFFDPLRKGEVWPEDELRRMARQLDKGG